MITSFEVHITDLDHVAFIGMPDLRRFGDSWQNRLRALIFRLGHRSIQISKEQAEDFRNPGDSIVKFYEYPPS